MSKITINQDRCKGCELCVVYCPNKLIDMQEALNIRGVRPAIFKDSSKCTGCAFCALVCPDVCIEVYK